MPHKGTAVTYTGNDGETLALVADSQGDKADLIVFDKQGGQSSLVKDVPRRDKADADASGSGHTWRPLNN